MLHFSYSELSSVAKHICCIYTLQTNEEHCTSIMTRLQITEENLEVEDHVLLQQTMILGSRDYPLHIHTHTSNDGVGYKDYQKLRFVNVS